MPTGYTAEVEDGTVTDFRTFALICSRGMMALIHQRDDDFHTLPRPREINEYTRTHLEECRQELAELSALTPEAIEQRATAAYEKSAASYQRRQQKKAEDKARYDAMLQQVAGWIPPTADHQRFKEFMIEQLTESLRFDCGVGSTYVEDVPQRLAGHDWYVEAMDQARRSLAYAEKNWAEEEERVRSTNEWIKALYESLPPVAEAVPA